MILPKLKLNRVGQVMLFFCSGLVLVFLSKWKLFLTSGVIGHNWDWNIPFLQEENIMAFQSAFFSWKESVFSTSGGPGIGYIFIYFLGALTNGEVQSKALLSFVPLIAFAGSFIFLSFISRKYFQDRNNWGVYLGSLTYAFSPSVFNDFVGGQLIFLVGYSFFPLYTYLVFTIFEVKRPVKYLFPVGLLFLIFAGSHFWWFSLLILASVFVCFYAKQYKKLLLTLAISFLSTAPILIYVLTNVGNVNEVMPESLKDIVWFSALLRRLTQTVDKVFLGAGYGDRNFFLKSLKGYSSVFFVISYFILIFALSNIFFMFNKIKDKRIVFWSVAIFLLGIFLVTSGRDPFGDLFVLLMEKIVFFRAFRTTFHFFVLVNLGFSVLSVIGVSLWQKKKEIVGPALVILFLLARLPLFVDGDNGIKVLKPRKSSSLDVYQVDKELLKILKNQFIEPEFYRVLYIPTTISPVYNEIPLQRWGQGADAEVLYSAKPILNDFGLTTRTQKIYNIIERNIIDSKPINEKFLGFLSFRRIINRRDVSPSFSKLAGRYNQEEIAKKLDKLESILKSEYIDYYHLDDKYFIPHFYIPQKNIYWRGEIGDLVEILDLKDYELRSEILLDTGDEKENLLPQIGNGEKEIYVKSYPVDLIKDEELGTYKPPKNQKPLEVKVSLGSLIYPLALKKEELDLTSRKTLSTALEYHLLLADKRISEFIVFGSGKPDSFGVFLYGYTKAMDSAVKILEEMKANKDKYFLESLARFEESLVSSEKGLRKYSFGGGVMEEIEMAFKNYYLKAEKLKSVHDFTKSVYQFTLPKEGEYEIYVREPDIRNSILDIGSTNPPTSSGQVIQYPVSNISNGDWKLLETRYFSEGENEYILDNPGFGENLVTDSFKINDFTGNTVYRVSLRYRTDSDRSLFSVNQSQEGKLFDYYLLKTGSELTDFEMFFRSSEDADKAFITLSVPEYEDLKIEKIRQPEILLRRMDIRNSKLPARIAMRSIAGGDIGERGTGPKITFAKVNPTKYRILVEGAKEPYSVVFSESFHKGWKTYVNKVQSSKFKVQSDFGNIVASYFDGEVKEGTHRMTFLGKDTFETWGQKPLPEERHYLVNGYANAWRVLPDDASGQENYELVVEFEPQRLYYVGLFISFTTLGVCFIMMIISVAKKRKTKKLITGN